jgi:hypothetical protein
MSEDGFHVHGPHDHAVEHAGSSHGDNFASRIAVATAILSTVGALFSFQGGAAQNDALLYKNEAAIKKTEASDQWNYFQAKGNKLNLAELGANLTQGETRQRFLASEASYKNDKEDIRKKADALEAESKTADEKSEAAMHIHHRWALAMTAIQIAISLAAITLLTRKKWLQIGIYAFSTAGLVAAVLALLQI